MLGERSVVVGVVGLLVGGACTDASPSAPAPVGVGGAATTTTSSTTTASTGGGGSAPAPPPRVLLFSKTEGFRHAAIPDAITALQTEGAARGWEVAATEDAAALGDLGDTDVVVFLLTSGDVLDEGQQASFEAFIRAGGGFVGVHSASDTEYDWPFYGELVGAYFAGHPAVQEASLRVERSSHLATIALDGLTQLVGATWTRTDEWYAFDANPRAEVQVLLSLDEATYDPAGTAMGDHPIAWYHAHEGGRAFYTALGHTAESYGEPAFVAHLAGGVEWASGRSWEGAPIVDFDGTSAGVWSRMGGGDFPFEASADGLVLTDTTGANQHLVRDGATLDPSRPYVVEALFTITGPLEGSLNSFCLNLNVEGDAQPSTWALNVDLQPPSPGAVMKHMGFVDGAFQAIGETVVGWGEADAEYLLRVAVHTDSSGAFVPNRVAGTVLREGVLLEQIEIDYGSHPHQPSGAPVRIGANTHGTSWSLRGLRAYYLD